jgi:hypothetical protein
MAGQQLPLQQVVQDIIYTTSFVKNTSGKLCLLIYDGHSSHITSDMVEMVAANNIHLFCLPPHTTHRLQPLDVGIFRPVQKAWMKNVSSTQ